MDLETDEREILGVLSCDGKIREERLVEHYRIFPTLDFSLLTN